jgi:hypothetical protein
MISICFGWKLSSFFDDTMPPVVGAVLVNLRRHGTQVGDGSGGLAVVWEEWNDEVMMNYRLRDIHERFSMVWTL